MRILIISPFFPPQHDVASLRLHGFAQAWRTSGADVTVLTTPTRDDQAGLDLPMDGLEVAAVPYAVPRPLERLRAAQRGPAASGGGPTMLGRLQARTGVFAGVRMPDLTDWWVRPAVEWTRAHGPWDVVVASAGPYTAHLVALQACAAGRAGRCVLEYRDLWTRNHLYSGMFPFTLRERRLERRCLRAADLVVTVSDGLAARLRTRTEAPVEVVPNALDPPGVGVPEAVAPCDGTIRLVYTGTLYPKGQDPAPLLRAMAALGSLRPDAQARLRLVTAGRSDATWRRAALAHGAEGMLETRGLLPRDDALRLQRDATALVLVDWRDPTAGVLTGKVFEYLHQPAPILVVGGAAGSEAAALVADCGRGLAPGRDVEAIERALEALLDGGPITGDATPLEADRARLGRLTRRAQAERYLALLEACVRPG